MYQQQQHVADSEMSAALSCPCAHAVMKPVCVVL
jgi:hypothetical protein